LFANVFSRCVRCFNCLPQAVVAAKTVAEFKPGVIQMVFKRLFCFCFFKQRPRKVEFF